MATWDETRGHLRQRYHVTMDEPTWLGLTWRFGDSEPARQRVQLSRAYGQPWLLIMSEIGDDTSLSPRDVLVHNMQLAIGAIAIEQGYFVVRHLVALDDLTWPALEQVMEVVAHEAAKLRRSRTAQRDLANIYCE